MKCNLFLSALLFFQVGFSQATFNYSITLSPIYIEGLPGLHSYAFAQSGNSWLIIGGRRDGIHARQPFNAFPSLENNTDIYVIDISTLQFWSASVNTLPTNLKEQLQSTNMNFIQVEDTLYIVGGYGYSASTDDHITFPFLTTIQITGLIDAVIDGSSIESFFKQTTNESFCVTGGELGKIENTFYLVAGQRFDGRYNPMDHPTFIQTYTNEIRKFTIDNSGPEIAFDNYSALPDPIHLRRRDYNLIPQIFPDGTSGYTISSGVFQIGADLPFLYPVDITADGYTPITSFNQYLSNYHTAHVGLYDSSANTMHTIFFGGMSRYYYEDDVLMQDDRVPFVKTISLLSRFADGSLQEYKLETEMPAYTGSGAEFIPNYTIPYYETEIVKLNQLETDTTVIGYIFGGIKSSQLNPFTDNQTFYTSADPTIYEVKLIQSGTSSAEELNGLNPYDITVYPNPMAKEINVDFYLDHVVSIDYYITNSQGQHLQNGKITNHSAGNNTVTFQLEKNNVQAMYITFVFEDRYFVTKPVIQK